MHDKDARGDIRNALKLKARLGDLTVWGMKKIVKTKQGPRTNIYWMVSWREDKKMHNVYLGSAKKLSREQAYEKARTLKAKALGTETF